MVTRTIRKAIRRVVRRKDPVSSSAFLRRQAMTQNSYKFGKRIKLSQAKAGEIIFVQTPNLSFGIVGRLMGKII